jgi:acyl-CoA thioester hydrolase
MFSITSRVYYQDTDAGGVIYHSKYLDFCERARTEFLRKHNIEQTELAKKENIIFVVRNLNIEYVASGKLDDLLEITVKITNLIGVRIFMEQKILRKSDNVLLAKLIVEIVTINQEFKPVRMPQELKEKLLS